MKLRNNKLAPAIKRPLKIPLNVRSIVLVTALMSDTIGTKVLALNGSECFKTKPSNVSVARGNSTAVFGCEAADGIHSAVTWNINGSYLPQLGPEYFDRFRAESASSTGQPVHYLTVFTKGDEGLTRITCENTCGHETAYLCVDCMDATNGYDVCGKAAIILAALLIAVINF